MSLFAAALLAITFDDVQPLLARHCAGCHRHGEAAPMPFETYDQIRPWAKAIREAVALGKMPPWPAEPAHAGFRNDRRLSDADRQTFIRWVDAGAPKGNATRVVPPAAPEWRIGQPSLIIEMSESFPVPASGSIDYQHFVLKLPFPEARWLVAAEVRPGNRAVVHHAVAFVRPPGSAWLRTRTTPTLGEEVLDTYVPGAEPFVARPGQAKLIPAGSDIVLQMHYTGAGKPTRDRTRIGLIFASEPPAERLYSFQIAKPNLVIPPGAPDHHVEGRFLLRRPVKLDGLMPHMHLRGKSIEIRAGGRTLLRIPHYDFQWQMFYRLQDQLPLPAGTWIEVSAVFDNSKANPRNPDPSREVRWGDQIWDEMLVAFLDVVIERDADPMTLFRK